MEHRTLGRTGLGVSAIGLGTEYLIDRPREHVVSVIHEALDRGVNYYDLFFAQPAFRDHMGAAFRGRRDGAILTAHLGAADHDGQYTRTRDVRESHAFFHDYLRRFRLEYVDILFLHNCDAPEDYDLLTSPGHLADLAARLREEGKARFIGFSSHTAATAMRAVESGRIDVLMFPVNLAGNAMPGKRDVLAACAARGVGVVAMKPYAGGRLLRPEPTVYVHGIQAGGSGLELHRTVPATPVQCLAYVLEQPGVSTVVPGCADREQLAQALAYWEAPPEARDFAPLLADYRRYEAGECVYCNHCLPCPAEIDVGRTMRLLDMALSGARHQAAALYAELEVAAADCLRCGECEERCPFGVPVVERMEAAAELFA